MNGRLVTIESLTTRGNDITRIIPLDIVDPISALIIDLEVSNTAAAHSMTLHPTACMTRVEVVDGSDVIMSLTGLELEALDWYEHKTFRSNYNFAVTGGFVQRFIGYQFGRYLWDRLYALDPKQFHNPQLKITLDVDLGGKGSTSCKLGVWAAVFDKKPISPVGFFMTKEIQVVTMAGSGHDYIHMPLDYPYRQLLIQSQKAGTEPNQLISNLKLSEDVDKRIPFNHGTEDILRMLMATHPPVRESYWFSFDVTARQLMVAPTTRVSAWADIWATVAAASHPALYDGDGGQLDCICDANAKTMMVQAQGWLPHAVWSIPFGDQNDPEDWYDVADVHSLILDVNAAAAETHKVFAQQVRRY